MEVWTMKNGWRPSMLHVFEFKLPTNKASKNSLINDILVYVINDKCEVSIKLK